MLRIPDYLSPSALALYEKNTDEYFFRYACPIKKMRDPQTGPMSVGSAFDAIVKNALSVDLFGAAHTEATGYRIRDLVPKQCEEHTLPESLDLACQAFEEYRACGAYEALFDDVRLSATDPRMEFDVTRTVDGVPLLGKPDLHFHTRCSKHVITDWKVSGSMSDCGVSPQQGYMVARDTNGTATNGKAHKRFRPKKFSDGVIINATPMNQTTDYWADQLATYAWCLGEPVGSQDFVCRIEQIAIRPGMRVKCVVHAAQVDWDYQKQLLKRYKRCWRAVESGHIFQDLTRAESDARCEMLTNNLQRELLQASKGPVVSPNQEEIDGWF